jgi:hypothetical protein
MQPEPVTSARDAEYSGSCPAPFLVARRAGRNAVQVQRWLGHHSPSFTLSVYVHLLDGDLGEPLDLNAPAALTLTAEDVGTVITGSGKA